MKIQHKLLLGFGATILIAALIVDVRVIFIPKEIAAADTILNGPPSISAITLFGAQ